MKVVLQWFYRVRNPVIIKTVSLFYNKMEENILLNAPAYWDIGQSRTTWNVEITLERNCGEYQQIQAEVRTVAGIKYNIREISRYQNIHDLGQTLIREQLLKSLQQDKIYYRVHRFLKLKDTYLKPALRYNLDPRRIGLATLQFHNKISNIYSDEIVIVVQVIASNLLEALITPQTSSDYFIDYIVKF